MMTPSATVSPTPALTDEATLDAALDCLLDTLPIEMQGNHTLRTLYEVLLWAASHHDSVNHASEVLDGVPSANDIRYHLSKFDDMKTLETWLKALNIPFLMPAMIRGKKGGTRALCKGRKSYQTNYTLKSSQYGSVECQISVVCRYHNGKRGKHGIRYGLFVNYRLKIDLHQLPQHYRDRFGIETSYRIKNQCRIRTTTKQPAIRLLFVGLAFVLVNLWVWLLWTKISRSRRGGRRVYQERFRLRTMLEFLRHAVERHFPLIQAIFIPAIE